MSNRSVRLCSSLGITFILVAHFVGRAQTRVEDRRRAVEHLASVRVVAAEVVESKWSGPCVHVGDGVIDIAVAENRQDGGVRRSSEI